MLLVNLKIEGGLNNIAPYFKTKIKVYIFN